MAVKDTAKMGVFGKISKNDTVFFAFSVVIFILGIISRIWWINNIKTEQKYDFDTYYEIAYNIYSGNGHTLNGIPVAWQGCGYSYALAFFFKIVGSASEINGKYFNVILSSITLVLSYFIYSKFFNKGKVPVLAAFAITSFLPSLIAYNNVLGTETFFVFLIACILFVQTLEKVNIWIKYLILGILCGATALTKPFMLAYPVILAVIKWTDCKDFMKSLKCLGLMCLACAAVISPWTYRNYRIYSRFIPISYNAGYCLFVNNNDSNIYGGWMDLQTIKTSDTIKYDIEKSLESGRSVKVAYELDPILTSVARKWIFQNPKEFLKLGLLRIKSTFFSGANDIEQWAMNGVMNDGSRSEEEFARGRNTAMAFFDISVYTMSVASFLFFVAKFKDYAAACFSMSKRIDLSVNIIFLNMAFFILIVFVFEGQPRYAFSMVLFMVCALVETVRNYSFKKP